MFRDSSGGVVIIWAKRKHRPKGTLLRRPCRCDGVANQFCVACRLSKLLAAKLPGDNMWDFNTSNFLKNFRAQLNLLEVPGADLVTWKAMRSGKATHMAGSGATLHEILVAGDWRSEAVFRYVKKSMRTSRSA